MTKPNTAGAKSTNSVPIALLEGEKVSFDGEQKHGHVSDEQLNSRYAKGEIRIVTEQARYPLAGILKMLEEKVDGDNGEQELRYKLDPEYQRRHRWRVERKSRLIESFLINVPVPPVFLYERELARFEVMDGRQRLTALSDFYADRFQLTGLQYWSDLEGRTYSTLPSKIKDGIDRRYISSIILLKETAATEEQATMLKKMVFERLNSGGVKLGNQETRNAVFSGPLNTLCLALSENEKFRRMWGIPLEPLPDDASEEDDSSDEIDESTKAGIRMFEKMEDVELVLRFFAYRQITPRFNLNKISELLDRFIASGNQFNESILAAYKSMFDQTISFLWDVLANEAFTVLGGTKRPTKIVYDPMMFVANHDRIIPHRTALLAHSGTLRGELESMYASHGALFSGRRTNFNDTQERNHRVLEAFESAITKIS